jgi:hypothetical protein
MNFLCEPKPAEKEYNRPETTDVPMTEDGVTIGRKKANKVNIAHGSCSGDHCVIYKDSFKDISSMGTFLHVRNMDEVKENVQSQFVPVNPNLDIYYCDYFYKLK